MKKINWNEVTLTVWTVVGMMLVIMMILFGAGCFGKASAAHEEQEPIVKYVEVQKQSGFDTSIIENNWCGDFCDGTIRMVGAWQYERQLVEDETGNVWYIEEPVQADDFLLLWIADNHTPDNAEDDIIVKVWREAH